MPDLPPPPPPTWKSWFRPLVWWVELLHFIVIVGATLGVYVLAGGDGSDLSRPIRDQLAQPGRPTVAASIVLIALMLIGTSTSYAVRRDERRAAAAWWAKHRELRRQRLAAQAAKVGGTPGVNGQWHTPEPREPEDTQPGPSPVGLVEAIALMYGPITVEQVRERLNDGGPWGAPLPATLARVRRLIRRSQHLVAVPVPGVSDELYDHTSNVYEREHA